MQYAQGGQTAEAPRILPVRDAMGSLSGETARIHDLITGLEKRLDTVLAAEPLKPAPGNDAVKARGSLANEINSQRQTVATAGDRLEALINRLEL